MTPPDEPLRLSTPSDESLPGPREPVRVTRLRAAVVGGAAYEYEDWIPQGTLWRCVADGRVHQFRGLHVSQVQVDDEEWLPATGVILRMLGLEPAATGAPLTGVDAAKEAVGGLHERPPFRMAGRVTVRREDLELQPSTMAVVQQAMVDVAQGRCPKCRHAAHGRLGFCANLASDNDCGCDYVDPPEAGAAPAESSTRPAVDDDGAAPAHGPWRHLATEVAQAIGQTPRVQRTWLAGDDLGPLIGVVEATLEREARRGDVGETQLPHLHRVVELAGGLATSCCHEATAEPAWTEHEFADRRLKAPLPPVPARPACGIKAAPLLAGSGPVGVCGKDAGHVAAGDRKHAVNPDADPDTTLTWEAQPLRADGKLIRTRHDLGNGGDVVAMVETEGMAAAIVDVWNRWA